MVALISKQAPVTSEEVDIVLDSSPVSEVENEQDEQNQLVERALQGDGEAFSEIVQMYNTLMLRTACLIVGDRDIAEDAVQDALVQAWQHLSSLRSSGALRPWLMRIVVNQCISFKRRQARTSAYVQQRMLEYRTELAASAADQHNARIEGDWDLADAIQQLPSKQQAVIAMHYYNGMTLPEMARELDISQNTLKKRAQAALANLRRALNN
ncbi:MAG TPA: RNA polymerase sigma factor [Ktedonobacteraceae bacterium]|jgi:RNA polymerase sigma-70 factor (ECF subfamily)|nr:RNA polymerase sigma factor [Ktedonobacteraceae bacterium]